MPEIISATTFRPRAGRASELLTLLTDLQQQIRTEPANLDYSINRALDPGTDALLVVQTFESADAFAAHSAHMVQIGAPARIAALIEGSPTRPELFRPVTDSRQDASAPAAAAAPPES